MLLRGCYLSALLGAVEVATAPPQCVPYTAQHQQAELSPVALFRAQLI